MEYQAFRFEVDEGIIPAGEIPGSKQINDFTLISPCSPTSHKAPEKNAICEAGKKILNWTKAIGFPSTYSDKHENVSLTAASTFAFMVPLQDLNDPRTLAAIYFVFWMYTMDDILDPLMEENKPGIADTILAGIKIIMDILSGSSHSMADIESSTIPHFAAVCRLLKDVVKNLETNYPNFHQNKPFLVRTIGNFLNAFLWRSGREMNGRNCSEDTYIYFRSHFSGFHALYELIALVCDVKLSADDRENIEFIRYMNAIAVASSVANDILSFRKEMNDCQTENFVMHKMLNKNMRADKAVLECIRYVNQETNEAAILSTRLLQGQCGADLRKYIELVNYSLEGHLKFCAFSKRYGTVQITPVLLTPAIYKNIVNNYMKNV